MPDNPGTRRVSGCVIGVDPGPDQARGVKEPRPPVTLRGGVLQGVPPSSDRWQRSDHIIARAAIGVALPKIPAAEPIFSRCVGQPKGVPVARYYFHIKEGAKLIYDLEGSEHPNLPAARVHALKIARDTWADAIKSGKSLSADAVVVADEHGELTFVPMAEALPKRAD